MNNVHDDDDLPCEPYYTPQEIASRLKLKPQTVVRQFRGFPGVIEIGSDESRFKRKRKFMRIPKSALELYIARRRTAKQEAVK